MYSIHNKGKSVVAERFIRTLKNKIYKYLKSILKYMYISALDDIDKYSNTYDVLASQAYMQTLIKKIIRKVLILKLVIMSEYQNRKIFLQNAVFQICLKKFFLIKKVKNTLPWTYLISNLNREEIDGAFYNKKLQKRNQEDV